MQYIKTLDQIVFVFTDMCICAFVLLPLIDNCSFSGLLGSKFFIAKHFGLVTNKPGRTLSTCTYQTCSPILINLSYQLFNLFFMIILMQSSHKICQKRCFNRYRPSLFRRYLVCLSLFNFRILGALPVHLERKNKIKQGNFPCREVALSKKRFNHYSRQEVNAHKIMNV